MKRISPTLLSIIVLILFALAFYFPLLFQQKMYTAQDWGRGDLTHFNYPSHHIYGNAIKQLSLPFWTDEIYSGFPLGAEGQVGMFYLPNLLLFFLFPNYTAFALSFFVVSLLATTGTYVFCRLRDLPHTASVFAAITFGYSMFFAGHFVHLNMVQAFSLIPWFFVLVEYAIKRQFFWFIFLALSLLQGQMFFTGHPQIALYTATVLLIYTYFRSPKEQRIRTTALTLVAICCGTIMAMVQLLPTWQLSKLSPSSELESAANSMLEFPYTIRDFLYFFLPTPFGNPADNSYTILLRDGIFWENNTFSGFLATIAVLALLFRTPKTELRLFFSLFITVLLFAMGWLYIFYYLPPFSLFRLPQRGLILSVFFFSILSAYGFTFLMERLKKSGVILACLLIMLQFLTLTFIDNYYNNPIDKSDWLRLPETAKYLTHEEGRIFSLGGVKLWEDVYTQTAQGWAGQGGAELIATKGILDPNRNATYGDIPSLDGYAKLVPLRTLAYLSLIRKGINEESDVISLSSSSAKLLGEGNVKHIVTAKPISGNTVTEKATFTDTRIKTKFHIYENPYYQPFIRSVTALAPLPHTGTVEATDLITDEKDWQETVHGEDKKEQRAFSAHVTIKKEKRSSQKIEFSTTTKSHPALVVISQSYDPNWHADIDGQETKIFPVNINSLGLIIPTGQHDVTLSYIPEWFIKGGYISLFGIAVTIIITVFLARNNSIQSG